MGNELPVFVSAPTVRMVAVNSPILQKKTVRLVFKFYPTKNIHLDCSKVHIIKAISYTKKIA